MSESKDDGGPVFPRHSPGHRERAAHPGMSLRDYLAGQAVTGIILHPHATDGSPLECARVAYLIADAMIKARVK